MGAQLNYLPLGGPKAKMLHYRRRWGELRGDEFDSWGESTWYFEVDGSGAVIRQLEVYAGGQVITYDSKHPSDAYGGLSISPLDESEFTPFRITAEEFENLWAMSVPLNRSV